MSKITSLEELDKKMLEQKERFQKEQTQNQTQAPDPAQPIEHAPFTEEMEQGFKDNMQKSQRCKCGWQNFGKYIVLLNFLDVMRETLPVPTIVCTQCGSLFVPKWARRIVNKAIDQENKIIKSQMRAADETGV
jgi:hypothetical protein